MTAAGAGRRDAAPQGSRQAIPTLPSWLMLVHLLVLAAFAVVQPTLSVLADSVDFFFPARRVEGGLFVLCLTLFWVIPPLVVWLAALLAGLRRPLWRWRFHLAGIWIFAALFVAYSARQAELGVPLTVLLTLGGATAFMLLYKTREPIRSTISVLAPAPIVFLVYFLGFTDASHLLKTDEPQVPVAHARHPVPVVVHVLDELPIVSMMNRDGHIDRARFPNIARLADESTWYRTATADAWTTFEAVPAILTGRHQAEGKLPVVSDHPENLFTLLREDYDERVVETFTRLCPLLVCPNRSSATRRARSLLEALALTYATVVAPRLERRLPTPGNTISAVLDALEPKKRIDPDSFETADLRLFPGPQFDHFLELVRRPASKDRRAPFYFLHSNLPHNPWNHVPDGRLYRDHSKRQNGLNVTTEEWDNDPGATVHGWQRHLLQAQFADRQVGTLLRRLRREGIYDDAMVVLVADHGVSFVPGTNRRKPRPATFSDIAMVPLFVKAPRQSHGRVEDGLVSTIDVLPTIAREARIRIPWRVDGEPLQTASRDRDRNRRLSLLNAAGGRAPIDPSFLRGQRRARLRAKLRQFGWGPRGAGFYGIGPARAVQGRRLASLPSGPPLSGHVDLSDAGDFGDVDLESPFVPALVHGTLTGGSPELDSIAIAVNGRVMGSGFLFGQSFELMVDPRGFREGRNDVEVLGVTGRPGGVRLHPLRGG